LLIFESIHPLPFALNGSKSFIFYLHPDGKINLNELAAGDTAPKQSGESVVGIGGT
jgi:hypothetical protein